MMYDSEIIYARMRGQRIATIAKRSVRSREEVNDICEHPWKTLKWSIEEEVIAKTLAYLKLRRYVSGHAYCAFVLEQYVKGLQSKEWKSSSRVQELERFLPYQKLLSGDLGFEVDGDLSMLAKATTLKTIADTRYYGND
jgi:hypothetical protein